MLRGTLLLQQTQHFEFILDDFSRFGSVFFFWFQQQSDWIGIEQKKKKKNNWRVNDKYSSETKLQCL